MNFTFRIIDSLSHEKTFIRLLHLFLSCTLQSAFHLSVKLYAHFCAFPFSFGKTNYLFKIICPLSVRFYSNLSSIRLSKIMCPTRSPLFRLDDVHRLRIGSPGVGRRHCRLVGLDGLEPSTSRLSGARSSHLSYKPRILTQRL